MPKIWIFGQSMATAFNLPEEQGWPRLLAERYQLDYVNLAKSASDNFYIYSQYLEVKNNIKVDDLVIIGWSHPSRKVFVLDRQNPQHLNVLEKSIYYKTENHEFFRNKNPLNDSITKFLDLSPKESGINFYDTWFLNYYSNFEQRCNFQSYLDSVEFTCPAFYVPFYFSKESVEDIRHKGHFYMVDFIIENDCAISTEDCHLNTKGHQLWANLLIKHIDLLQKNIYN